MGMFNTTEVSLQEERGGKGGCDMGMFNTTEVSLQEERGVKVDVTWECSILLR